LARNDFPLVVFDLDGTLIDSQNDLADAANALIVELGGTPFPVEAIARMVGDGAAVLVRRALADAGLRVASAREALQRFLTLYDERLLVSTRLYDGMADAIDELAAVGQLAVLTNKPEDPTRRILNGLGVSPKFKWVIGGDGSFPRKPDPAGLQHLMEMAGRAGERSVMIGDSAVDLATARAAGTRVCLARYGFGYRVAAADLHGDELIVDSPREIVARLGESFL
jgi:phosphoglycolate phosphatase